MGHSIAIYGETELRSVLYALVDMEASGGLRLTPWEHDLATALIPQRHYSNREKLAIERMLRKFTADGTLERASGIRKDANSEGNHARAVRCVMAHADNKRGTAGQFWCPICNTGHLIHYRYKESGLVSLLCDNHTCVRHYSEPNPIERKPRFSNIIPQDIGTFLVESETQSEIYYLVDVVLQSCTCDDFRFRNTRLDKDHRCKHLLETNFAVYGMRVF